MMSLISMITFELCLSWLSVLTATRLGRAQEQREPIPVAWEGEPEKGTTKGPYTSTLESQMQGAIRGQPCFLRT